MGKTSTIKALALHVIERGRVTIIDYDGEYTSLPLLIQRPPFPINVDNETLSWILSQAARPEEGGYALEHHFQLLFERGQSFLEIMKYLEVDNLPLNIKQALKWRLFMFQKYFVINNASPPTPDGAGVIYDLSSIRGGRAKEVIQQMILSYLLQFQYSRYVIVEEAPTGPFLRDILVMSRRKGQRLIMISQKLPDPDYVNNFEFLIFTPFMMKSVLPIPVDPSSDRGVWWIGRLGVKRLSLSLR